MVAKKRNVPQYQRDNNRPTYYSMNGRMLPFGGLRSPSLQKYVSGTVSAGGKGTRDNPWSIGDFISLINSVPKWARVTWLNEDPSLQTKYDVGSINGGSVNGVVLDGLRHVEIDVEPHQELANELTMRPAFNRMDEPNMLFLTNSDLDSTVITMKNCNYLTLRNLSLTGRWPDSGGRAKYGIKDDAVAVANGGQNHLINTNFILFNGLSDSAIHMRKTDMLKLQGCVWIANTRDFDADYPGGQYWFAGGCQWQGLGSVPFYFNRANTVVFNSVGFGTQLVSTKLIEIVGAVGRLNFTDNSLLDDVPTPIVLTVTPTICNIAGNTVSKTRADSDIDPTETYEFDPRLFCEDSGFMDLMLDISPLQAGDTIELLLETKVNGVPKRVFKRTFSNAVVSPDPEVWNVVRIPMQFDNKPKLTYTKTLGVNRNLKFYWMHSKR